MISPAALREISTLQHDADNILSKRAVTRADQKRADLIVSRIATIRSAGISSDEQRQHLGNKILAESGLQPVDFSSETPEQRAHQQLFRRFLKGDPDSMIIDGANELRSSTTLLAGSETPIFTTGPQGGFIVPTTFASVVAEARAAVDPLFSADVCSLIQEDSFKLPQVLIPGWDLTTAIATKNTEGTQHAPDVVPPINGTLTGRHRYALRLAGSFEFENDSRAYGSAESALARAIGVGFARGVGQDLVTGAGGATAPQGALTGAVIRALPRQRLA